MILPPIRFDCRRPYKNLYFHRSPSTSIISDRREYILVLGERGYTFYLRGIIVFFKTRAYTLTRMHRQTQTHTTITNYRELRTIKIYKVTIAIVLIDGSIYAYEK